MAFFFVLVCLAVLGAGIVLLLEKYLLYTISAEDGKILDKSEIPIYSPQDLPKGGGASVLFHRSMKIGRRYFLLLSLAGRKVHRVEVDQGTFEEFSKDQLISATVRCGMITRRLQITDFIPLNCEVAE